MSLKEVKSRRVTTLEPRGDELRWFKKTVIIGSSFYSAVCRGRATKGQWPGFRKQGGKKKFRKRHLEGKTTTAGDGVDSVEEKERNLEKGKALHTTGARNTPKRVGGAIL